MACCAESSEQFHWILAHFISILRAYTFLWHSSLFYSSTILFWPSSALHVSFRCVDLFPFTIPSGYIFIFIHIFSPESLFVILCILLLFHWCCAWPSLTASATVDGICMCRCCKFVDILHIIATYILLFNPIGKAIIFIDLQHSQLHEWKQNDHSPKATGITVNVVTKLKTHEYSHFMHSHEIC